MAARNQPIACTIVARNYLPAARVLAHSYLESHPDHRFVVAVLDADRGGGRPELEVPGARVVGPEAFGLDQDSYLRMATAYSVMELATSVKPYLLRTLRTESEVVIYLDPDIQVYTPMPELAELAREHQIVLTPHFLHPLPQDGKEPGDAVIMGTGMFNLGFLAVGPGSEEFLDFWAQRLRLDAVVAPDEQLFTDQRWVDQVPSLYRHHVLRDPGFNVAYWNTHERPIGADELHRPTAAGYPLRFFHFSGYRPDKPWLLSYHCSRAPRTLLSEHPRLRELCDGYARALSKAGYDGPPDEYDYGFAVLADGTLLTPLIRRMFRNAWIDYEREDPGAHQRGKEPPPPYGFGADGGAGLVAWLGSSISLAHAAARLSRLGLAIWGSRTDLRAAFPEPAGADAAGFRRWCRESGPSEVALPDWARPDEPDSLPEPADEFGVNIVGYLTAELGLGEMGRIVHDAIAAAEVPLVSVLEERALCNRTGMAAPSTVGSPRFPVTLLCVNADQVRAVLDNHPEAGHRRYRIGLWAWELEEFPSWLHPAFEVVDEVWTISEFTRKAIAAHSQVPVRTIPVPVRDPGPSVPRRLPGGPVRFLFAFDFNSVGERKNPWGTALAFQQAFGDRADVRLVLKSINSELNPHAAERLRMLAHTDPRIELIERYLDADELHELYTRSHCYVSLHRSEGFGLTVAEAMARGMPVIATDYSGTAEFLGERTGWPIPYRLVEVGHGCFPYQPDALWAEPDLDTAVQAMRQVADDPDEAARRGWAAREHVLCTRSMEAASAWLAKRLRVAYQAWLLPDDPAGRGGPGTHPEHTGSDLTGSDPIGSEPVGPTADLVDAAEMDSVDPDAPVSETASEPPDAEPVPEESDTGAGSEAGAPLLEPLDPLRAAKEALRWRPDTGAPSRNPLAPAVRRMVLRTLDHYDAHQRAVLSALAEGAESTAVRLRERIEALERRLDALEGDPWRTEMQRAVEGLTERAPQTDQAMHRLAQHTDQALARIDERMDELRQHTNLARQHTAEMFVARDRRADEDEAALRRLSLDVLTTYRAAALRHAPVPEHTEVVLCDAGALLVPTDEVFLPWLLEHRSWEDTEAELMARLVGDGLFLDIGAHAGYHTLRLIRDCPGLGGVVAVEANPDTARLLRRNIEVNLPAEAADRITVLPVAAWDSETSVRLVQEEAGNSGDYRVRAGGEPDGVSVPAVRLDGVPEIAERGVRLVKIDLQGRDHRALAGLTGVLERDRPHVVCEFSPVFIEALGDDPAGVLRRYRELGYQPVPVGPDGPAERSYTDDELISTARRAQGEFSTLWLVPAGS